MLERIFEYGVSEAPDAGALAPPGQGLFVACSYMAKMCSIVTARNVADGVVLALMPPRAAGWSCAP